MKTLASKSALLVLATMLAGGAALCPALPLAQSTDSQGVPVQSSDQMKADQQGLKQESKQDKKQAKADKKAAKEKAKAAKNAKKAEAHQDKAAQDMNKANTPPQ